MPTRLNRNAIRSSKHTAGSGCTCGRHAALVVLCYGVFTFVYARSGYGLLSPTPRANHTPQPVHAIFNWTDEMRALVAIASTLS